MDRLGVPTTGTRARTGGSRRVRTGCATLRVRAEGTGRRERRVEGVAPERFVVTALVTAFVADYRQKLEPLWGENATQGESLGK